jgi:hypothetical protein
MGMRWLLMHWFAATRHAPTSSSDPISSTSYLERKARRFYQMLVALMIYDKPSRKATFGHVLGALGGRELPFAVEQWQLWRGFAHVSRRPAAP